MGVCLSVIRVAIITLQSPDGMKDSDYIKLAIEQAKKSVDAGGFPAGAVIVKDGKVISEGISVGFKQNDPSGHAESAAIREASKNINSFNLEGATLYESIECCVMCFTTSYWAGISRIVYACKKTPEMVSKQYYEGTTDNQTLNRENNRQIELVFDPSSEQDSVNVSRKWEDEGGFHRK